MNIRKTVITGAVIAAIAFVAFLSIRLTHPGSADRDSPSIDEPVLFLVSAAAAGQTTLVRDALAEGVDVNACVRTDILTAAGLPALNARFIDGMTALMSAAEAGHRETVEFLLEVGADVNAATANNRTALHFAAGGCHTEVMKLLLGAGADVNALCSVSYGPSALHIAVSQNCPAAVRLLLETGADANLVARDGEPPLITAVRASDGEMIELLTSFGADVNSEHQGTGATPLHIAAESWCWNCVSTLIRAGADLNAQLPSSGATPLMIAADNGLFDHVETLLEAGADPALRDQEGRTAYQIAREHGFADMATLIQTFQPDHR